jgi:hypothetical protein
MLCEYIDGIVLTVQVEQDRVPSPRPSWKLTPMARYFFDVRNNGTLASDEVDLEIERL